MTPMETTSRVVGKPRDIWAWEDREYDLLDTLARRIPLLDAAHIRRIWWPKLAAHRQVSRQLSKLADSGFLDHYRLEVRWPVKRRQAWVCWKPGEPEPDFRALRAIARPNRMAGGLQESVMYLASRQTANLFGVDHLGRLQPDQFTELLAWGELYVSLHRRCGEMIFHRNSADDRRRANSGGNLPAHLRSRSHSGEETVFGLLAHGSLTGLLALHAHCRDLALPYLLW